MAKKASKEILVDNGERKVLKELFKTSYPTIKSALQYRSKTALAHKIRIAAIERGGVVVVAEQSKTNSL